ncbi:Box C/D snoRNA protein 1 [Cryptosporidium felis]|nr:Box C/D snoRNA protein 1 [Cryptosporidium felis]
MEDRLEAREKCEVNVDQSRKCDNCENEYKYKCPECSAKSCSLECVNKHKSRTGCDGNGLKKHIEKNISISQYTDADLHKDLSFLETVQRKISRLEKPAAKKRQGVSKDNLKHGNHPIVGESLGDKKQYVGVLRENSKPQRYTPIPLLKKACGMRMMKINFCPISDMEIRRSNTSYYDKKKDLISWKMEFQISSDAIFEKKMVENVSEEETIIERVSKLIEMNDSSLIKVSLITGRDTFQELEINKSFKENLLGKEILEFPRFRVEVN